MKKILLPLVLLFSFIGHSQFITVDESLTVQELIEDVLINSTCAETSNYSSITGTDFGEGNGIGAFNANGSDFPYQSGIILSSGFIQSSPGPNLDTNSDGSNAWPGDADLEANTTATGTNNASYIEFDFVPLIDVISFNFLFASEEYNQNFECTYSDAFAFILTNQVTGVVQNLAVLPGTSIPIEATNIHPDVPGGCPAINEGYFDKYNFLPFNDENTSAIDYNGQIVSLMAEGSVTIGNTYTIKLVIADETDTALDSAVFLEAGSFNLGVNLGDDLTIAGGNAPCEGQPLEISITGDTSGQVTYQWYVWDPVTMMFVIIPGETTSNLTVTTSGTYQIESIIGGAGGCAATDDILIEFAPQPIAGIPDDNVQCDEFPNDGFSEFDLTINDVIIINGEPNVFLEYYITLAEAEAGLNPILNPATFINTIPSYQIIYAKLEEITLGCYDIVPLVLQVDQVPSVTDPVMDYFLCDNDGDGIEDFDLTSWDSEILNTLINVTLTYHNTQADADANINVIATPAVYSSSGEEIWFRVENVAGCVTVRSFNLVLGLVPVYTEVLEFDQCDDDVLDGFTEFDLNSQNSTITGGNSNLTVSYYLTQLDADAATAPLSIPYTNTVNPELIFVRVESNTTGCYGTFAMELEVIAPPDIFMPLPLEYCDQDNDGFGEFTLTDADQEVTGGIPTGNLMVTYHYTLPDSQNGVNPLVTPYLNDVPYNQVIYVRLLDQSTGCYSLTTLELVVLDSPQSLILQPTDMEICDDDGDGVSIFDLTLSEPEVLNGLDPLLYIITYFEDVNLTIPIANPIAYSNIPPSPQTIYIVVEDIANGCQGVTTLLLWVHLPPVIIAPVQIELCDMTEITGPGDELEPFDLESATDEITGGDANILISYYETQVDADAGTNPLTSPYVNSSNPQTIFIRAEGINTGCIVSTGFTLDLVVNPLPSPVIPTPLESCDGDNDGFAEFMLTDKDVEIIGGEPGVSVSYHETLLDAENGVLALASPFINTLAYNQVVYVRAEYALPPAGTGCYDIVELELIVLPSPEVPIDLAPLVMCDDDGFTVFDLTLQGPAIYGVQDPLDYTLTYYITQADAEAGINVIANPGVFPNTTNPQTIWVRLEDNLTFCEQIGSFDLVVDLLPVFTVVTPFEVCDDELADGVTEFDLNSQNATITGGDPNLGVTYYPSQVDADDATNALAIPYTNTTNPELIYVRIEDNTTGCYDTFEMELVVVDRPTIFDPEPLEYCDQDNDGFGEFTLTNADMGVTGGVPIGNLQVSYHYLLEDAQNDIFPLASPYLNDVPYLQTVYVRLLDQSTGCYNITTLDLVVLDSPQVVQPTDLELCDDNGDGIEVFDLTLAEPELLNGLDPLLYTVTYYADAALTVVIGNPTAYSNIPPSPQTIYIVVEDIANGCISEQVVVLWVHSLPVLISPTPLELCDLTEITGPDDQTEPFDLESATDEITGGNTTITVTYYETQADADAGINPLLSPYLNISNPQTVFIRAEDLNTSCIVSDGITLDLVVNPLPSPVPPTPLEVCDVDNDGFAFFELTDKDAEIINNEPDVTVTYYETLLDAQDAVFALTSPYPNITTPTQIVYARAEYSSPPSGTGCYRVVELELIVNPTPVIPLDLEDLVLCDDDGDGFSIFDLTERSDDIYGTQDPLDYTLTYYELEVDAEAGTNPIATPTAYLNTVNPQVIWVRLEDNITQCIKLGQFEIRVELGPVIIQPEPLSMCDDLGEPNDETTVFDLTLKNDEITGGALGVVVTYYETESDSESDINVIDPDTAYINTSNPQTLWVRVRDVNTGCFQTGVYLTLIVEPNPDPEDPDPIILCDVTNPNDGFEVFNLTSAAAQILDGESWELTYYESSYADAVEGLGVGEIVTPTSYTNTSSPQIVWVRATIDPANPDSCFEIVELELVVNPLPDDSAVIEPYIICEIPSDGLAIFDLTSRIEEILNGQDPLLFEVSFYLSQGDADLMLNPIQDPDIYQNISNPQTIFVVIENIDTGCFVSTQSFEIEERQGAFAITPLDPYAICDTWEENDGIAQFDLLDPILADEILGGQDPLVYSLFYYSSPENAVDQVGALPFLYVNTINPQVVYARVTHIASECYDIAEVILKVELLPEFSIEDSYRLCIDAQGNPLPGDDGDSPPVIDTGLDPSVYIFEWQLNGEVLLGEIGASITATSEGTYTVTATEIATGCSSEPTSTIVTVSSPPLVYDVTVVTGAFASLHNILATAEDGYYGTYEFQLDDGVFQSDGSFIDVEAGNHIVTIRDINGCGSVTVEVGVIDYPQFMTPNADGYHDTWNIIGIAYGDPTAKIYIFDRYGKLLKQLSPLGEGWDGTYNGNPMPSSDYWFRIEYTENDIKKEFKGHFTLKR